MRARHTSSCSILVVALLVVFASAASAQVRDGVGEPVVGDPPPITGPTAEARTAEVLISFDDLHVACTFGFVTPLRDRYHALGVDFFGGPGTDGGAIINACGNFFVTGYSGENFLAWNGIVGTTVPNFFIAALPEVIVFSGPMAAVSANIGSGTSPGLPARFDAYNAAGTLVATNSIVVGPALQTLTVSAPGITRVVVSGPEVMVLDDLRFTPGSVVPALASSWGRVKSVYR